MQSPVPEQYTKNYYGCRPNPKDDHDVQLEDIALGGAYYPDPHCPTYEQGFDNEEKYGRLIRDHQGSSLSCVGNGWSKYEEMLNLIEMIKNYVRIHNRRPSKEEIVAMLINLSAKDIYSQIFLPQGGAYIRSGAKIVVKPGVCEESFISSYPEKTRYNTGNPDENFMRERKQTPESKSNALIYKAKLFVKLPTSYPMTEQNWEDARQIIWQFGGFVSGFNHHCSYYLAYGMKNGLRYIKYLNSYGKDFGEDGIGKWFERDGRLFNITFLVDKPNSTKMTTDEKRTLIINIHHELLCREATPEEITEYTDKDEVFIRKDVGEKAERLRIIRVVNFARLLRLVK